MAADKSNIAAAGDAIFAGIDPGKDGALVLLMPNNITISMTFDRDNYIRVLKNARITCALLEKVGGMPGQSAPASFNFGANFGFIQGLLEAFEVPYQLVSPQKWKRAFGITSDKNTSIEAAHRLFPNFDLRKSERCRKPHDGLAEALLMAEYMRRVYNGR